MKNSTLCFASLLLFAFTSFAQTGTSWITTSSGVRARTAPATSGEEVMRLPIGSILRQVDNEKREATIGDKKDFWYHVSLPNGKDGWAFGAFLVRFDESKRGEIYRSIAAPKLKSEEGTFAEFADLTRMLTSAATEIAARPLQVELEMQRLLALQKALALIPADKLQQPEYQRFVKPYQSQAVYSEVAGIWLIKTDLLWNLSKKNSDLPVADTIAWEAANLPIPGECETDDTCHIGLLNETIGRYLALYPQGKHVGAALEKLAASLNDINEMMKNIETPKGNSPQDREIRKAAIAGITKMRSLLTSVENPKKNEALQLLAKYEKNYRVAAK